jgi:hypothetical protein
MDESAIPRFGSKLVRRFGNSPEVLCLNAGGTGWADATVKNRGNASARMMTRECGVAIGVDEWVGFILNKFAQACAAVNGPTGVMKIPQAWDLDLRRVTVSVCRGSPDTQSFRYG